MVRALRHLLIPDWLALRAFPSSTLNKIEEAVRASEATHRGEIRFAVEAGLPLGYLSRAPRARAEDVFAALRVWDTAENTGVLVYVQLVDRDIEVVADRGIAARVKQEEWEAICQGMEAAFREGRFEQGSLECIARITALLREHFPARPADRNELPDRPAIL